MGIISVVIHDRDGIEQGALGLQFRQTPGMDWVELPWSGHGIATIFVGSILERISRGLFPAAQHRVVGHASSTTVRPRAAATFFFRPAPDAMLRCIPVPDVLDLKVTSKYISWDEWKKQIASRYEGRVTRKKNSKQRQQNVMSLPSAA